MIPKVLRIDHEEQETRDVTKSKFQGAILGSAIGDAMGYPVRYITSRDALMSVTKGGVKGLYPHSLVTDNYNLSGCVSRALLTSEAMDLDPFLDALTTELLEWYNESEKVDPDKSVMVACERLKRGIGRDNSGIDSESYSGAVRSFPIGLVKGNSLLSTIDWGKESSVVTHNSPLSMCSSAAVAMLTSFAMLDVPVGTWANELSGPLSGVCSVPKSNDRIIYDPSEDDEDRFMDAMSMAVELAGESADPWDAMSKEGLGDGNTGVSLVACALFCSMSNSGDFGRALQDAVNVAGNSSAIGCLVGAVMGAKLGVESIPEEWIENLSTSDDLLSLSDDLYELKLVTA